MFVKHTNASEMANSKMHGKYYKDKYFGTSRKILSQEMIICILIDLFFFKVTTHAIFFLIGQKVIYQHVSQGIFMWNIKALGLTVYTLLARLKFPSEWQKVEMTEWKTAVNIESCSLIKKQSVSSSLKYYKNNHFISANSCLKYSEEVEKNCLYKVCEKNADRI